jgi:Domain of unknown function (DUF3459)
MGDGAKLELVANLTDRPLGQVEPRGRRIWSARTDAADTLGPWSVIWSIADEGRSEISPRVPRSTDV